jgi:hypothetical protein
MDDKDIIKDSGAVLFLCLCIPQYLCVSVLKPSLR